MQVLWGKFFDYLHILVFFVVNFLIIYPLD